MVIKNQYPTLFILLRVWGYINEKRKKQFFLVFILMVISGFAEMTNIGAILGFLTALTSPEILLNSPKLQFFIKYFSIDSNHKLLLAVALSFAAITIVTNILRLTVVWTTTRLSYATGTDLSIKAFEKTLYQPYLVHIGRNSADILNGIRKAHNAVTSINLSFNFIGATIMASAIVIAILVVEPYVALFALLGFVVIYGFITYITGPKLYQNSLRVARDSTKALKIQQEGLGGIRDILLDGSQHLLVSIFSYSERSARRSEGNVLIIESCPRYFVESLGILLMLVLSYTIATQSNNISQIIPILGALALAAQRLLPALQNAYQAWSGIQGLRASLEDALNLLDQPVSSASESPSVILPFKREIRLNNVSFNYSSDVTTLKGIDLVIPKGARVGFIGKTGGGKSTLTDIIMGLLNPASGFIEVDGIKIDEDNCRAWQRHIAHVPQHIFLADCSIEENIAFGVPKDLIDPTRVRQAASKAQLADFIEKWPLGYKTHIGERGVRLSGGQRQRLGIARALYKNGDVIVFDEATSALDSNTEEAVMAAIDALNPDLTILMVAHRVSTLKNCDFIVELADGAISRVGNYNEICA